MLTYKQQFNIRYKFNKDKSHSLIELSMITKIPLRILTTVFNRGIVAYKTNRSSVRPKERLPNVHSPEQWAYSRVYAFIEKSHRKILDFDMDL